MAWRDSRRNRSRLLLFVSSIILGIAALVAIQSFSDNLRDDIDDQAKTLLGADLGIYTNKAVEKPMQKLLRDLGGKQAQENYFASMILFPKNGGSRLVQIRALQGNYPFYGAIETTPATASRTFRNGQNALVDKTVLLQFNARPGDSVKIGNLTFKIVGELNKIPGQAGITTTMAPAVYIPMEYLDQTGLMQKGSRINYRFYYQFPPGTNVEKLVKQIEPKLEKDGLNYETVKSKKENTGKAFGDLTRFLTLVGFIALLLGCVGVASAVHIYIKEKIQTIAILRCLGTQSKQAFFIYLIQILVMGFIGSVIGAGLGTLVQRVLPVILADFLPVAITVSVSWKAVLLGISTGIFISFLFALLPLVSIRNISPLNTLRASFETENLRPDSWRWGVYGLIILFVLGFAALQMDTLLQAVYFTGALILAFLVLAGMATLLVWLVRKFFPVSWSYLWRQSIANLYRPNNQTLILIVAIGLGTGLIATLFFIQSLLIGRVTLSASGNQPNMVLFDIQTAQKEQVASLAQQYKLPLMQQVPIVTMRLEKINNLTDAEYRKDSTLGVPDWAFTREYRVTYRDSLISSEKITQGKWHGTATGLDDTIYVSLDESFAERMKVKLGDTLLFNVQGAPVQTIVGSFRKVDWNRIQSNFLVLFPKGILEEAPQFHVIATQVSSNKNSADFQRALVTRFPNVSVIDLALILTTLDEILSKIAFVIRFMAGFSIATGILVLIGSVLISKFQRVQESVLLRTLGASRRQILIITALEYFFLGALAAATGLILALGGSWALAHFSFEIAFTPNWTPIVVLFLLVTLLTVVIGLFNSRSILNRPPLEVLRSEIA
ncbi:ABC transporter permease [Adhaeribacter swui]|uniref:ABC transporter permease n=2 Tax=Adhaeribacter swui TaxID=2086471 RepID=A0A7G7GF27_9BACT|nr:ABC transporter permease [Adhaeribacter swui]